MKNYRATFSHNQSDEFRHIDLEAENNVEAWKMAFSYPEARSGKWTDLSVEEVPDGGCRINGK